LASATETLFVNIKTSMDATGLNQGLELFSKFNQSLQTATNFLLDNTIGAWAKLENQMIGIARTTGFTDKEMKNLTKELFTLSAATGQAVEELANIGQVGGLLGIQSDQIATFTVVVNQAAIAWQTSASEAALAIAKISAAFQIDRTETGLRRIGDVINTLGNTAATSGLEISAFLKQFGGFAKNINVNLEEAAALGAVLITLGAAPELASTQLISALTFLTGKGLEQAAEFSGVTTKAFKAILDKDVIEGFELVIGKLKSTTSLTDRLSTVTEIFGRVGAKTVIKLIENWEKYAGPGGALDRANKRTFTLQVEFDKAMKSITRQFGRTKEALKNIGKIIGVQIGEDIKGPMTQVGDEFGKLLEKFQKSPEAIKQFATAAEVILAIGIPLAALSAFITAFGPGLAAIGGLMKLAFGGVVLGSIKTFAVVLLELGGFLTTKFFPIVKVIGAFFLGWNIGTILREIPILGKALDTIATKFANMFLSSGPTAQFNSRALANIDKLNDALAAADKKLTGFGGGSPTTQQDKADQRTKKAFEKFETEKENNLFKNMFGNIGPITPFEKFGKFDKDTETPIAAKRRRERERLLAARGKGNLASKLSTDEEDVKKRAEKDRERRLNEAEAKRDRDAKLLLAVVSRPMEKLLDTKLTERGFGTFTAGKKGKNETVGSRFTRVNRDQKTFEALQTFRAAELRKTEAEIKLVNANIQSNKDSSRRNDEKVNLEKMLLRSKINATKKGTTGTLEIKVPEKGDAILNTLLMALIKEARLLNTCSCGC